jgi:hypothetical protein
MRELVTIDYCESNKTKSATRGYKTVCPSCRGRDLWVTPENNTCYCWECGVSYKMVRSLDDVQEDTRTFVHKAFDTKAIRSAYGEAADYYHSCISKEHEVFLRQRGITQESINFFKIGFCPSGTAPMYLTETAKDAGLANRKGEPWLAERIVFPYIADGEITDIRGRSIHGEDPKYLSLYHRSEQRGALYPYNYDAALKKSFETKVLILTEGEIKAVVADRLDFAIMALPGMLSYRSGLVAQPGIKMVVVFDNSSDQADRIRVDRAIARMTTRLPAFSVVTLPLLGEHKMDIDAYLLHDKGGKDRFQYYVDNAINYTMYKRLRSF